MLDRYVVNFSGGKDSTAMLLKLIENNAPIDDIIYVDTGLDFPETYLHLLDVEKYISRSITVLKPKKSFEELIELYRNKKYCFPSVNARWCNSTLKMQPIQEYRKYHQYENIIDYIGIAIDEPKRVHHNPNIIYPLLQYNMTEKDCLNYCNEKGFNFYDFYSKHTRMGCWCCPLQNHRDKEILRYEYPELWNTIKEWEKKYRRTYFLDKSIEEYEDFDFPIF